MKSPDKHSFSTITQNLIIISIGVMAVCFRIGHEPLWLDESYSATISAHSFMDIWRYAATDVHPPLYYLLLHLATLIGGTSELAYRLPSAGFALGLVLLGTGPISSLYGRRVGILFSLLTILAPSSVSFSQEARMYTMMAFLVTGFTAYGLLTAQNGRLRDVIGFVMCYAMAMYTHYYALLAAAVFGIFLLCRGHCGQNPHLKLIYVSIGIATMIYLPWVPSFWEQVTRVAQGFWIPPTNGFILEYAAMMPFSFKFEDISYPPWALISMGIAIISAGMGIYRAISGRKDVFLHTVPLAVYGITFAAGVVISWSIEPVLMPRYLLFGTPLFFLSVAIGMDSFSKKVIGNIAFVISVLLMIPTDMIIYQRNFNGPFREVASFIKSMSDRGAVIVHEDWQTLLPLRQQLPNRTHLLLVSEDDETRFDAFYGDNPPVAVRSFDEIFQHTPRVWFIDSNLGDTLSGAAFKDNFIIPVSSFRTFTPAYSFIHPQVFMGERAHP